MRHSQVPLTPAEQMQRIREAVLHTEPESPEKAYAILTTYFSRMKELRNHVDELESKMLLKEPPVGSRAPLIGPCLQGFRALWHRLFLRWYAVPLVVQQNQHNMTVTQTLRDLVTTTESLAGLVRELEIRVARLEKDKLNRDSGVNR
jgi:hypothetical protein